MVSEDYVSFEVAKLLKEKGFEGQGEHFYEDNKITNYINYWFRITPKQRYEAIEAPTHQMALKWLRQVYGVRVGIIPYHSDNNDECWIVQVDGTKLDGNTPFDCLLEFKTHEEAVEATLKYFLKHVDAL